MNIEKRISIERQVVRHLVDTMAKHGWIANAVDDGGDEWERVTTTDQVLDAVFAVDEAHIMFRKQVTPEKKVTHSAFIVLGNDGWDCVCDYSYSTTDDFEKIMTEEVDPFCEKLAEEC